MIQLVDALKMVQKEGFDIEGNAIDELEIIKKFNQETEVAYQDSQDGLEKTENAAKKSSDLHNAKLDDAHSERR